MPILTSAGIRFFNPANTDDKDDTTTVIVELYTWNLKLVARNNQIGVGIRFPDDGTYSPTYHLNIVNHIQKNEIEHGNFLVSISLPDNDRWIFQPTLTMNFDDGSTKVANGYSNRIVAQDARDASFVF